MGKKKNSSVKKIDDQIKKLSSTKTETKTPVNNKDLVRKVKAKQIDEKIESNKSKTNTSKKKKKKGYYYKKKEDLEKTKVYSKPIKEFDVLEHTTELNYIYNKELLIKKDPNTDFYSNEFLNNVEDKFKNVSNIIGEKGMKVLEKIVDLDDKTLDTQGFEMEKWDRLSLITLGIFLIFSGLCILLIIFIVWICIY